MQQLRKYVLTIAGFDPSGGAGLTADIKTFEQHHVYGLSVCTSITLQTENVFKEIRWEKLSDVLNAIDLLFNTYKIEIVKVGIIPSLDFLETIVDCILSKNEKAKIIYDPILKSSTHFNFINKSDKFIFFETIKKCFLITPNIDEAKAITDLDDELAAAKELSSYCHVFLKGGHSKQKIGVDYLFTNKKIIEFKPNRTDIFPKHGSGCILSSAIAANIALEYPLEKVCELAKHYTEKKLLSNQSLLAYHHV